MPRVQVYLPDDLYEALKTKGLPASELLQDAVRAELRRRELAERTDAYLAELVDEVGEPTAREIARAEALADRIEKRSSASRAS
jgi:post-segregation antitoxin (ccd killing protein)